MSRHALLPPSLLLALAATTTSAFAAAPTASAVSATANEDSSVKITLKGADADHNSLTYSVVSNPAHGSVTLSSSSATYKPTANWNGTDTFTYKVRDSTGLDSATATVTVSVKAVNDAPTVSNTTLSATEDTALTTTLSGSDVDGDALRFALTTAPGQGSVTINSSTGAATYTPSANWSGTTTFKYSVSDATSSTTATVTVNVAAVNDPPTASASSVTLNEDTTASVSVTGSDIDSSTLTYALVNRPAHGSATLSGRALTYTPTSNWSGTDTLTFTVSDGSATSAPATVTFSVAAVNDPPTVTDASTTTNEDTPVTFQLPGSDPEGDRLTWQVEGVTNGSVTVDSSGRATFTPTTNAFGSGRFTFRASDGTSLSGAGTATITLVSVNDAPVATATSVSTTEDGGSVSINLAGSDADNDTLTFALASNPSHGSVAINGHTAVYRAYADYNGADAFTFTVNDGTVSSAPATVSLAIAAVNDPPTAYATSAMTTGGAIAISVDTSDPDSTVGTPTIARAPSHGRASIVSGRIQYTPDAGFIGVDHLAYAVSDGTTTVTGDVKVSSIGSWDGAASEWSQVGVNSIPFYADATSGGIRTASASYQGSYILDDFYDLGLETYRQLRNADLTWQSVEPSNGLWQTDDSDDVFAQDDVEPRITLFDATFASPTPPWATSPTQFQKGMNADAYDYLDTVLAQYGDQARYWEIGNEMFHWASLHSGVDPSTVPDLPASYPVDGYSPEEQARFMRDVAEEIRAVQPDALIVLPSVLAGSSDTDEWLERVVAETGSDWFDVVTYHAYDQWDHTRAGRVAFEEELAALGLDDKLVQLTETGTSCDSTATAVTDYPNSSSTQSSDIFRILLPAFAAGDSQVIWHTYRELSEGSVGTYAGLALLDYSGNARPAAWTMQMFTSELLPLVQVTDLSDSTGTVNHYVTRSEDGAVHHVYWGSGAVTVPSGMVEFTLATSPSASGTTWTRVSSGATVTLSSVPVIFR